MFGYGSVGSVHHPLYRIKQCILLWVCSYQLSSVEKLKMVGVRIHSQTHRCIQWDPVLVGESEVLVLCVWGFLFWLCGLFCVCLFVCFFCVCVSDLKRMKLEYQQKSRQPFSTWVLYSFPQHGAGMTMLLVLSEGFAKQTICLLNSSWHSVW